MIRNLGKEIVVFGELLKLLFCLLRPPAIGTLDGRRLHPTQLTLKRLQQITRSYRIVRDNLRPAHGLPNSSLRPARFKRKGAKIKRHI